MKGQLKQMLVDVVRERYKATGSTATPAQVRATSEMLPLVAAMQHCSRRPATTRLGIAVWLVHTAAACTASRKGNVGT